MPVDGTPVMESGGNSEDARSATDKSSSTVGKYFMVLEFMHSMILLSMMMSNQHHRLLFDGMRIFRSFESDIRRYASTNEVMVGLLVPVPTTSCVSADTETLSR